MDVQDEILARKLSLEYPQNLVYSGMTIREENLPGEPSQPYTKPGANTGVLHLSDGTSGIIYDAENIPNPHQPLQFILGTMDGVSRVNYLAATYLNNMAFRESGWSAVAAGDARDVILEKVRGSAGRLMNRYVAKVKQSPNALMWHYRYNFKLGGVFRVNGRILKRHMRYFVNHTLKKLLEVTGDLDMSDPRIKNLSTGLLWEKINDAPETERRELINLYIVLANMPDYGSIATQFIKGEINRDEFIQKLIIGEFRRINEPVNGQGRLAKVNNALHRSQGQVSAYMYGEYASWYTAGWDGFHAAQDTFKPLGGTTGYFCTAPVQEIEWAAKEKDASDVEHYVVVEALRLTAADIEKIKKHYNNKNRLLTLGAWDEFQVAEDYMLGLVSWWYGFNISAFYSLTPEDPAGIESGLSVFYRAKQISRWIKGYIIGLVTVAGSFKNMGELYERKGLWGCLVFFTPTLCSAILPLFFRVARLLSYMWWVFFIPVKRVYSYLLTTSLAGNVSWLNSNTGIFSVLIHFQDWVKETVPMIMNFLPKGWEWGLGVAIVLVPIFIHRYFTMRGIFRGVDDRLGVERILSEYDELIDKLERKDLARAIRDRKGDDIAAINNAIAEIRRRKDIVQQGKLSGVPGVLSPWPFAALLGFYLGGIAGILFASGGIIPNWTQVLSITAGLTALFCGAIMFLGWLYVRAAQTAKERSVRAMRFRTAMANFFIDHYHLIYLDSHNIALRETLNGGRIGYWWRTPRITGIREEAVDRNKDPNPWIPGFFSVKNEGAKRASAGTIKRRSLLGKFFLGRGRRNSRAIRKLETKVRLLENRFRAGTATRAEVDAAKRKLNIILKDEEERDKEYEKVYAKMHMGVKDGFNYAFMTLMTFLVIGGLRHDVRRHLFGVEVNSIINKSSVTLPGILTDSGFYVIGGLIAVAIIVWGIAKLVTAINNWGRTAMPRPWSAHAFTAKAGYKAANIAGGISVAGVVLGALQWMLQGDFTGFTVFALMV
ncbi:MAG: hypothetical protein PVH45_05735, partial [Candidatus Omnitrophota bacterium]